MRGEFYKMDFRAWNTGTVDLTLEQEAAYLRLCHAMYDIGGPIPDSTRFLMSVLRCGNAKASGLVRQLVKAGKIQRTDDKKLSNRRVMSEISDRDRLSRTRSAAGEVGGRARHAKPAPSPSDPRVTPDCPPSEGRVTPDCPSTDHRQRPSKSLKNNDTDQANASTLRSRGEERRGESPIVPKGTEPEGFAEFWKAYPKRKGDNPRSIALRAYAKAIGGGARPDRVLKAAQAYAIEMGDQGKTGTEYVPMAATWLNQGRFERFTREGSEASEGAASDPESRAAAISDDTMRAYVRRWKDTSGQWLIPKLSEPPDDPRTRVPPRILAEFGITHSARPGPSRAGQRPPVVQPSNEAAA